MGKTWDSIEIDWLKENYDTYSGKDLAVKLGRTVSSIQTRAKLLSLHLSDAEKARRFSDNGKNAFSKINGGYGKDNLNKKRGKRKSNLDYKKIQNARYPGKNTARDITRYAVKTGKIVKTSCEVCGCIKAEAHHVDYSKPLIVRWLCHKHHMQIHGK